MERSLQSSIQLYFSFHFILRMRYAVYVWQWRLISFSFSTAKICLNIFKLSKTTLQPLTIHGVAAGHILEISFLSNTPHCLSLLSEIYSLINKKSDLLSS